MKNFEETGAGTMNVTPELLQVARHVVWYDSPEHTLQYPTIFLAK